MNPYDSQYNRNHENAGQGYPGQQTPPGQNPPYEQPHYREQHYQQPPYQQSQPQQPPYYQPQQPWQPQVIVKTSRTNGMGTAGFVLSLITLFIGWLPVIGWILWLLGLIFSLIGVFKAPRGLAIAGLVISLLGVVCILLLTGVAMTSTMLMGL